MVLRFAIKKNVKSLFQMFALHLVKFIQRNKEYKYDCCTQLSCMMGRRGAWLDLTGCSCGPETEQADSKRSTRYC